MSRATASRRICIYDGSRMLGTVRERPDRIAWLAFDGDQEPLGEFRTSIEAARAVTTEYDRACAERLRQRKAAC